MTTPDDETSDPYVDDDLYGRNENGIGCGVTYMSGEGHNNGSSHGSGNGTGITDSNCKGYGCGYDYGYGSQGKNGTG